MLFVMWFSPVRSRELDSVVLMGPFQLEIFFDVLAIPYLVYAHIKSTKDFSSYPVLTVSVYKTSLSKSSYILCHQYVVLA